MRVNAARTMPSSGRPGKACASISRLTQQQDFSRIKRIHVTSPDSPRSQSRASFFRSSPDSQSVGDVERAEK